MTASATRTGIFVGAILALTWITLGFWPFAFVAVAMAIGAFVGRLAEGKISMSRIVDAFRGNRSSS